jgi:hypothetical protein
MNTMMKKVSIFMLALTIMIGFYSCKKDETRVVLDPANVTAPALDASLDGAAVTITADNQDSTVTMNWTAANYGFNTAINYYVQMDLKGNNFSKASTLGSTKSATSLTLSLGDLNNKLLLMEEDPEVANPLDIEFRVVALISSQVDTVSSQVISMTFVPYAVAIVYPQLYVPGAYQGWAPDQADSIGSINSDDKYEGYIYMPQAGEFKFTSKRAWDGTNYGDGGTPGTLSTDGGAGNLSVDEPGFYKFNVNTTDLTWTSLKTTWGLIGDATPGGWDTDTPMTYNPDTQLWTVTLDLNAADIKFRANSAWDLNYGSNDANGKLQENGANIHIDAAGNYTITLDLSHTVYRYKIEKN